MKKIYFLIVTTLSFATMQAQGSIAEWSFEGTTNPTSGTGTFTVIGGAMAANTAYPSGQTGSSYAITKFPTDSPTGQASGTAGFRFNLSTVGFSGISFTFYIQGTNPASKWAQYEYSTDGGQNWTVYGNNNGVIGTASSSTWTQLTVSGLPASCDNNPNFAFRIVSVFGPSGNYESVVGGGYNGDNGQWRIDGLGFSYATLSTKQNEIEGLKVYPNPAKNTLYVTSDNFVAKEVKLYDMIGKSVLSTTAVDNEVNISSLTKGVYMAKITEEGKTSTRKILVE
jgi:hypothetical protein